MVGMFGGVGSGQSVLETEDKKKGLEERPILKQTKQQAAF